MANFAPDRLLSLIVGAAHPFEDNLESFQNIDVKDPDAFVKALEAFLGEKRAPEILPLLLTNDLEAFAAAARPRPNMEDMLPRLNIPCLLFSFSMVIQDIVAMGFGSKLHYLQPICIAELIFVPEISIRNLDKIASVCSRFPTIHARFLFGVKIVDC